MFKPISPHQNVQAYNENKKIKRKDTVAQSSLYISKMKALEFNQSGGK